MSKVSNNMPKIIPDPAKIAGSFQEHWLRVTRDPFSFCSHNLAPELSYLAFLSELGHFFKWSYHSVKEIFA